MRGGGEEADAAHVQEALSYTARDSPNTLEFQGHPAFRAHGLGLRGDW